jgi:hypothetical protein
LTGFAREDYALPDDMKTTLLLGSFLLAGCIQAYWAFPPGKDLAAFRRDELQCNWGYVGLISTCLKNKGYQEISYEEFVQRQQKAQQDVKAAMKPIDVAAYEVGSHEIFVGKSESVVEPKGDGTYNIGAALRIEGLANNVYCSGQAELLKTTGISKGSIGSATLLCKDGRMIKAVFTYESPRSGYGSGTDSKGREYRFVFGDLNLNPEELRKMFEQPPAVKLPT